MSAGHHLGAPEPTPSRPPAAVLPARIGARYEVRERLGQGGNAVVYRVRDRSASHDVALKQLLVPGSSRDRQAALLFEREFQVLSQLRHPSVIEVYDFGIAETGPYYTMELLDGGDLSAQAPLAFRDACQLMMQVCSSLSLLHSRRLLHRDISPRNVRRTRAGVAKLIDFGAMVPMGPCLHSVGTPGFVAPEVVHHLALDARTDLFSVGATLYYALTGERAFAARTMAELNEAWRVEPVPPGHLVADIPAALDELVLALLRIDPARRPRSAFEVMQRLAAAAGVTCPESEQISQAYLSTPTLVGRESEQRRFRHCIRRALQSDGCALIFEGASGMGRSRLLDMCVLEGKTAGATVLRIDGAASGREPFAAAHSLAEQLARAVPDSLDEDAADPEIAARIFAAGEYGEIVPRAQLQAEPYTAQAALLGWFRSASRRRLLLIAIDDCERIDDASLALIIALVHAASGSQLLVIASIAPALDAPAQPALAVLRRHSTNLMLEPLSSEQTEALFASIFFDAPHVALVSHRIHQLAAGRPREAIALAQHLVNVQLVRFTDGNWVLPSKLAASDLPTSAEEALRLRIAELPPLARQLVEAHALALEDAWARADYLALRAPEESERVEAALSALLRCGVLVNEGATYTLNRLGVANFLVAQLAPADAVRQHLALAGLYSQKSSPLLFQIHHLLQANQSRRALDLLMSLLRSGSDTSSIADASGMSRQALSGVLEPAYRAAVRDRRSLREINDILCVMIELSSLSDSAAFDRYAPRWLEQLEHDCGLRDYHAAPGALAPGERLQLALTSASARFDALPEHERVYRVDEALRYLARYVNVAIVNAWRACDTQLIASLPAKLAPFATAVPILHAIWQTAIGACEMMVEGRLERARTRFLSLYEQLRSSPGQPMDYVELIRFGTAHGIASIEVVLGYSSAERWIEIMEQSPVQRVNALFLRRVLCIFEGDTEAAERLRRQAEVLGVQTLGRQMFDLPLAVELHAQIHAGDLAGLKHAAERGGRLAADLPGWLPLHHAAEGHFQYVRGDLRAAKLAFERALELTDPERVDPPPMLRAFITAVAGQIRVLTDLGEVEAACRFGTSAVARCEALEITDGHAHIRALALAESKAGRHAHAAERLDRLIAQRAGMNPALVAADFEARALCAIWAGDHGAAQHFACLAMQPDRSNATPLQLARRGRLLDAAARAGVRLDVPASGFETAILKTSRAPAMPAIEPKLAAALERLRDPATRAERSLELVCERTRAAAGQLYQARAGALVRTATRGSVLEAALDRFVRGCFQHQLEQAAMSTIFTATEQATSPLAIAEWTSPSTGMTHSVALIKPIDRSEYLGAIALLAPAEDLRGPAFSTFVWALAARMLELGS